MFSYWIGYVVSSPLRLQSVSFFVVRYGTNYISDTSSASWRIVRECMHAWVCLVADRIPASCASMRPGCTAHVWNLDFAWITTPSSKHWAGSEGPGSVGIYSKTKRRRWVCFRLLVSISPPSQNWPFCPDSLIYNFWRSRQKPFLVRCYDFFPSCWYWLGPADKEVIAERYPNLVNRTWFQDVQIEMLEIMTLFSSWDCFKRTATGGLVMFFQQWTGIDAIVKFVSLVWFICFLLMIDSH